MRIVLVGGGTGGSVGPLLSLKQAIQKKKKDAQFLFIGPKSDRLIIRIAKDFSLPYKGIHCSKLRRYFDLRNFLAPFLVLLGIIESIKLLKEFKPKAIFSSGSFAAVPVGIAGWLLKISVFIHQQDVVPSLTNRLLSPFARKITVSLACSLKDFPPQKTVFTGNPVKQDLDKVSKKQAEKFFSFSKNDLPVILVFGGSQGAALLNELVCNLLPDLLKFSKIIHLTGNNFKCSVSLPENLKDNYRSFQFLGKEMPLAYKLADIVVCRAGMGTLSELSFLGKPSIVLPIAYTHQEANALYFLEHKAIRALFRNEQNTEKLLEEIRKLIQNPELRKELGENIKKMKVFASAQKILDEYKDILGL